VAKLGDGDFEIELVGLRQGFWQLPTLVCRMADGGDVLHESREGVLIVGYAA
jgi:hypothetical protein